MPNRIYVFKTNILSIPFLIAAGACAHYNHGWWAILLTLLAGFGRKDSK